MSSARSQVQTADPWHDAALFEALQEIWTCARTPDHKLVWCNACKKRYTMRQGANGCHNGHIGIVEVTEERARALESVQG